LTEGKRIVDMDESASVKITLNAVNLKWSVCVARLPQS